MIRRRVASPSATLWAIATLIIAASLVACDRQPAPPPAAAPSPVTPPSQSAAPASGPSSAASSLAASVPSVAGASSDKPLNAAEATTDQLLAHKRRLAEQPMPKSSPGYEALRFDRLAGFIYITDPPDLQEAKDAAGNPRPVRDAQIPPEVKALDGTKVTLRGLMVPIDFHKFQTNEFILVQALPDCFFCQEPMVNEWVHVKTADGSRVPYTGEEPITIAGTLRIGAVYDGKYLDSLYRLELDKLVE